MSVRIAIVQQDGGCHDPETNRRRSLAFARQALEHTPDIVLFHESLLQHMDAPNFRDFAEAVDGPTTQAFREVLEGTATRIIYGLTELAGGKYYTAAVVVSAAGVVTTYRKTHLFWKGSGEATHITPGERLVTFDLKGYKSGIMICYDGDFPEMFRSYANLDCALLFWINKRLSRGHEELWDGAVIKQMARNNSIIVASCCPCSRNPHGAGFCGGGSNVTDARGELLSEMWGAEGIVYADVHPDEVAALRRENAWFVGQRQDLYV